jgi:hypothetical protein
MQYWYHTSPVAGGQHVVSSAITLLIKQKLVRTQLSRTVSSSVPCS